MAVPYRAPVCVYVSSSTECLLQRPGGPRFATQEVDIFGDPYVVGLQVGFRRRSLGRRPSIELDSDDEEPHRAPVARRWSAAAMEFGRKHRPSISFRRGSHASPSPPPPQAHPASADAGAKLSRSGSGRRFQRRRSSEAHDGHLPAQPEAPAEAEDDGDSSPFHTSNPFTDSGREQQRRETVLTRVQKRVLGSMTVEPKMREAHNFVVAPIG